MALSMTLVAILEELIRVEGGYVNNPNDSGGETIWGITVATARRNGYKGEMKDMTKDQAVDIYMREYVISPGFDKVFEISQPVAKELIDTGVNMGQVLAVMFLQRALNAFNSRGKLYPDVVADGFIGEATLSALHRFLEAREKQGEVVLLRCLNCLQGERYISLAEKYQKDEDFVFGWFSNRIML